MRRDKVVRCYVERLETMVKDRETVVDGRVVGVAERLRMLINKLTERPVDLDGAE